MGCMLAPAVQIPANSNEAVYIPFQVWQSEFDKHAIDPGMINHRLTREEIDEVVTKVNDSQKGAVINMILMLCFWFVMIFPMALILYFINHLFGVIFGEFSMIILAVLWIVSFVRFLTKHIEKYDQKQIQALEEENENRLHSRRLRIVKGHLNLYLILYLDYSPPPEHMPFHYQTIEMEDKGSLRQPLLV
eukprot:TRINITY_DN10791_c0_g1_i2.p1 TRINITY_DN10791_c0_g1~~TRINITY_DN10791_c0_g1_i2.p1  ORF type:complete len:190 (+),score=27.65 TRINITY_DN10791_c0_g1_i2:149-718(+)